MKHKMNALKSILPFLLLPLVACASNAGGASSSSAPKAASSVEDGEFHYEDPAIGSNPDPVISTSSTGSSRTTDFGDLDVPVLVTVDANGEYKVEAEDCDTSGCTLQELKTSFYEATNLASGNMCIACISAPSILAFSFALKGDATVSFVTACAKYENPWNLDANVSYHVDGNDAFVTGYTSFGRAAGNDWYNWKEVSLGTLSLQKGTHTMYITVKGAFPNTDYFKLTVSNYTNVD